ncbi:DNA sulfur modification protein DndE [Texcoconibacillus texcoconensis]|uniref:DNA sulfur modification protein DndE n=1 Tax=Texcoconibacillus texcoconensis TaxID=1095777 RepID=A0A840QM81_9BACI|nr:DNA sulfur modification protein DndE [Texcoconibacillus texcoconensis]MBB5172440.1 DNA sulfur modification protein DndE [Texcoconibacillus texcoconensis]
MNFRLKTTQYTAEKLKQLHTSTNLTPNILARLAVSLSLKEEHPVSTQEMDTNGIEFNRNTLTGKYDYVFKALIAQHCQREISDDEYFPGLFNAHLERGIRYLANEYQYAGNSEKFLKYILSE